MGAVAKDEKSGRLAYYFASHPHPEIRIEQLKQKIGELE